MPFDGNGNFNLTDGNFTGRSIFTSEKSAAQIVTAAHVDAFANDIGNGLQNCVTRDGQVSNITNIKLTATANSTTGVITIGTAVFGHVFGSDVASTPTSVFVGSAGNFSNTGTRNIGVGYQALNSIAAGAFNVAIGAGAGTLFASNQNCVAIGDGAAGASTFDSNTVAIGARALQTASGGNGNVAVGFNSGGSVGSGGNNICIGAATSVPTSNGNNQLNIACTIFGTGNDGVFSTPGNGKIGINNNAPAYTLDVAGDFGVTTAGKGLRVKEGSNAKQGTTTLAAGTVTVANTSVTANSRIFLTAQTTGGTAGALRVSARVAGTSFTITSTSGTDTSVVAYQIFEPA